MLVNAYDQKTSGGVVLTTHLIKINTNIDLDGICLHALVKSILLLRVGEILNGTVVKIITPTEEFSLKVK